MVLIGSNSKNLPAGFHTLTQQLNTSRQLELLTKFTVKTMYHTMTLVQLFTEIEFTVCMKTYRGRGLVQYIYNLHKRQGTLSESTVWHKMQQLTHSFSHYS